VTTFDEKMVKINRQVDGFGGFYKKDDEYVIVSKNGLSKRRGNVPKVTDLISKKVGLDVASESAGFSVSNGEYEFTELMEAKDEARRLLSKENVSYVDISEKRNRVVVGVTSNTKRVTSKLSKSVGAVSDRVVFERAQDVQFLSSLQDDYTGYFKQGGLEIGYYSGYSKYLCTKSTTTKYYSGGSTEYGFLTNSHCTAVQGGVEGTEYYQDAQDESTVVGVEENDPAYFTGGVCPSGQRCRYSDAAFVDYQVYGFDYGGIHLTTSRDRFNGSLQISGEVDISEPGPAGVGTEVDKVGRTTGWTYGDVQATCVDVTVNDVTMLCQTKVNSGVGGGDSGSPVFRSTSGGTPSDGDSVKYLGILWGGIPSSDIYYYSPHSQIEDELAKGYRVQD
jgi:hypothetical protein